MELLLWGSPKTVNLLEKIVNGGDVVLSSGDTVLGLLAAVSLSGFAKLNTIKRRSGKAYLILAHDHKQALSLIQRDNKNKIHIENIMNTCWPGPVTLIFKAQRGVADYMKSPDGTIALRVPDHPGLLQLAQKCEKLGALPSTILDCTGDVIKIVRQGAFSLEKLACLSKNSLLR